MCMDYGSGQFNQLKALTSMAQGALYVSGGAQLARTWEPFGKLSLCKKDDGGSR